MEVEFVYSLEKSLWLKQIRGICFEEVIQVISQGGLLDVIEHPNQTKHKGQQLYVVDIDGYVYLVPFTRKDNLIELKTIFPSRKATRKYLATRYKLQEPRGRYETT